MSMANTRRLPEVFRREFLLLVKKRLIFTFLFAIIISISTELLIILDNVFYAYLLFLAAVVFPYFFILMALRSYEELSWGFSEAFRRIRKKIHSSKDSRTLLYSQVEIFYNKSMTMLSMISIVLLLFLRMFYLGNIYSREILDMVDLGLAILAIILLNNIVFPSFEGDYAIKSYRHYDELLDGQHKHKIFVFILVVLVYLIHFLNSLGFFTSSITTSLYIILFICLLYVIFNYGAILSYSTREIVLNNYIFSVLLSAMSLILGVLSAYMFVSSIGINLDLNNLFLLSLIVLVINFSLSLLAYSSSFTSSFSSKMISSIASNDVEKAALDIGYMTKVSSNFKLVILISVLLVYVPSAVASFVELLNIIEFQSLLLALNVWRIIFYVLVSGLVLVFLSVYKIGKKYLEDLERELEDVKRFEERRRKKQARERKIKKTKKEKPEQKIDINSVVKIIDEFESIFEED